MTDANDERLFRRMLDHHGPRSGYNLVVASGEFLDEYGIEDRFLLAERFTRKAKAEMEWFESLIHHQPTVGTHYEIILRNSLEEVAPHGCAIATGFVVPEFSDVQNKQLDILVYDRV